MLRKFRSKPTILEELLAEQREILGSSADMLVYLASQNAVSARMMDDITHLEHRADGVYRAIVEEFETKPFTPIDPLEGARMARKIEAMIDAIHTAAKKMHIYEINPSGTACLEFAKVVKLATTEIQAGGAEIGVRKANTEAVQKHCQELHHLEGVGDEIYTRNLTKLMKKTDIFEIVQLKDVYNDLERCIDLAEDVGDALDAIMIRMV